MQEFSTASVSAAHAAELAVPAANRSHSVCRHQGRPSASPEPRPARGDPAAHRRPGGDESRNRRRHDRRCRARSRSRHARGAGSSAAATRCLRFSARRAAAKSPMASFRWRDRGRHLSRRSAGRSRYFFNGDTAFRGLTTRRGRQSRLRFLRFRPPRLGSTAGDCAASYPPRPCAPVPDRRPTAMTERPTRRPATFKLDDPMCCVDSEDHAGRPSRGTVQITPEIDSALLPAPLERARHAPARGFRWGTLFWGSLAGLVRSAPVLASSSDRGPVRAQ